MFWRRKTSKQPKADGPTIHIHEDDWGLRYLYPEAAFHDAEKDMKAASDFAEAHRARDGIGWTDIYLTEPPKLSYADLGVTANEMIDELAARLPRAREFRATCMAGISNPDKKDPWGSYETDPHAYGFSHDCFIKIELHEGAIHSIWFEADGEGDQQEALIAAIMAIHARCPSIILDYMRDEAGKLSDAEFVSAYFSDD